MVLELRADTLRDEVRSARELRDQQLRIFEEQVAAYHGPFYRGRGPVGDYNPENHAYDLITSMVPQMIYRNPRVRVDSNKAGLGKLIGIMYKHLLNRRVKEIDFESIGVEFAHDMLMQFCVGMVVPRVDYRYGVEVYNPTIERIPQRCFLIDPYAKTRGEARWLGHEWWIDKDDLLARAKEEDGWSRKAIESLPEDVGSRADKLRDVNGPNRGEVRCIDMWIRDGSVDEDANPEEGFHGVKVVLGWSEESAGEILYGPRPAFVPANGPYRVGDVNYVPDSPFGLSPLVAVEGQSRELNKLTRRAIAMAMRYARFVMVEDGDPEFGQRVKEAETDLVLAVKSLEANRVQVVERGGVTDQVIAQIELARQRLDRNSKRSDAQRGMANKNVTATAEAIADSAGDVVSDFISTRFDNFSRGLLDDMAYYYWYDERARSFLGGGFLAEMGMPGDVLEQTGFPGFEYKGGDAFFEAYRGLRFEDLEISIEPMSMRRVTEAVSQKRALDGMQAAIALAQNAQMLPGPDYGGLANLLGDALNVPDLAKLAGLDKLQPGQMLPGGMPMQQPGAPEQGGGGMLGNETGGELAAAQRGAY